MPQERPWGFTEQAEVVNGRLAMAAITLSIALTSDPSLKALVAARAARNVVGDAASAVGDALPPLRVNHTTEVLKLGARAQPRRASSVFRPPRTSGARFARRRHGRGGAGRRRARLVSLYSRPASRSGG